MRYLCVSLLIFLAIPIFSQRDGHDHPQRGDEAMDIDMALPHTHKYSLGLPMNRNGSGTGWLPDDSPMYGSMWHPGKWMAMFHGNLHLRYNSQDVTGQGTRGDSQFDAPNWMMIMGQRKVGQAGLFALNMMLSLDPLTVGGSGYPFLFQTGETWQGQPLIDRQHPHNFFSEVSAGFSHMINSEMDFLIYVGYPGEPALGPVAFMHRPSAMNNPDAPLSHHWQDATHITFGVATLGFRWRRAKIEGSVFTGREPGENRWGFDDPRFDSYSFRASLNPTKHLAIQASYGYLTEPEIHHPGVDVQRSTVSVLHNYRFGKPNRYVASALIWGLNIEDEDLNQHSVLAESNVRISRTNIYGRYEWVQKTGKELDILPPFRNDIFGINALTIGSSYILYHRWNANLYAGVQGTLFLPPDSLKSVYGDSPKAAQVYLRISPAISH